MKGIYRPTPWLWRLFGYKRLRRWCVVRAGNQISGYWEYSDEY